MFTVYIKIGIFAPQNETHLLKTRQILAQIRTGFLKIFFDRVYSRDFSITHSPVERLVFFVFSMLLVHRNKKILLNDSFKSVALLY